MATPTNDSSLSAALNNNNTSIVDHKFEGWSVWLEIDNDDHPVLANELLYNFPAIDEAASVEDTKERAEYLLESVKTKFREHQGEGDSQEEGDSPPPISLTPTDFHFFHYPKYADKGKGFGCVISMLLIEKEEWLSFLYTLVQDLFPKDERGSNNFVPHLSLVYAPEDDLESLAATTRLLNDELLKPIPVRYLSLWSTEGSIADWYRIARIEL